MSTLDNAPDQNETHTPIPTSQRIRNFLSDLAFLIKRLREHFSISFRHILPAVISYDGYYGFDARSLFLSRFRVVPSSTIRNDVDIELAIAHVSAQYKQWIIDVHEFGTYDGYIEETEITKTIFVLRNRIMVAFSSQFVQVLHYREKIFAEAMLAELDDFEIEPTWQEKEFYIYAITYNYKIELKSVPIQPTRLDLDMLYNDDFKEVDEIICKHLFEYGSKGIFLLHGIPGTGKTTYLKHLVGQTDKKFLFLSNAEASNLRRESFLELFIDYPNSILIIEDAEDIVFDRKSAANYAISNLLTLTDGMLSDALQVQVICTFNCAISAVDEALLRKGRLIARYEFKKLTVAKAQRLSDHYDLKLKVTQPMTLAEIFNPEKNDFGSGRRGDIGFKNRPPDDE